jgi:hypothetical protein
MTKELKQRIQKVMKKEARLMREEQRRKNNFYGKLTTGLLMFLFVILSFYFWLLNASYDRLIEEAKEMNTKVEQVEEEVNYRIEPVRITCYLATGNRMANGKYPSVGQVAVSDRSIPLNTKIELNGIEYNIGDRTNKRFEDFDLMTIDIFVDWTREQCLEFGVQYGFVKIFDN